MEVTGKSSWDLWIEEAVAKLESRKMFLPLRPMHLAGLGQQETVASETKADENEYETFQEIQPWDRVSVQISVPETFFQHLLHGAFYLK
ncbi:hypothetical protein PTKIN_Ptkin14bG0052400 [Pterospermum kingtungense]